MERMASNTRSFGQWVKQRRKALDLIQADLAECVGCAPATIQMIEQGQRRPSKQTANLLAQCLRIPDDERDEFIALARGSILTPAATPLPAENRENSERQHPATNLPILPTPLVGREEDVATLTNLLTSVDPLVNSTRAPGLPGGQVVRLLTLTGPPGVGKTSLAIEVATRLVEQASSTPPTISSNSPTSPSTFRDHVAWVPLGSLTEPEMVIPTIARTLEIQALGTEGALQALKRALKGRNTLLLLDNFEQVIDAASDIADLLASCPTLRLLVTSREALRVRGEREYSVSPLPYPDVSDKVGASVEVLARNPSVALFVERARSADRHFSLTSENAMPVASICARLEGIPLAIELVAAQVKMLPVKALLARLQGMSARSQLDTVSGGARDLPGRHRTLRDTIGWSYDLLSSGEQLLFRRLGIFSGGFTISAARAICNAYSDLGMDLSEGISQLLHKSLLSVNRNTRREADYDDGNEENTGFTMLDMIREYSLERLRESGEESEMRQLHVEYFLAIATAMDQIFADLRFIGEDQSLLMNQLDRDYDNLRAVLAWTVETNRVNVAAQLAASLAQYWELRGYFREGRDWSRKILALRSELPDTSDEPMARIRLLQCIGRLSTYLFDYTTARSSLEESLRLSKRSGLTSATGHACMSLGNIAWLQGDYSASQNYYNECLEINRATGSNTAIGNVLWAIGRLAADQGDYGRAETLLNQSLTIGRDMKDMYLICGSLRDLGMTLSYQGKYARAVSLLEEGLDLARQAGFSVGVTSMQSYLGVALIGQGDYARAEALLRQSLTLARDTEKHRIPVSLEGLAEVELALAKEEVSHGGPDGLDRLRRAATLFGAAEAVRRTLNIKLIPVRAPVRGVIVSEVRSLLGDARYEQAYAAGERMSLDEAITQ